VSDTDPEWRAFRDAIYTGDFARACEMLSARPALLQMSNGIGETVLHFLAVEDDRDGVAWLHAKGADLDTKNVFDCPAIFEVASLGYKDLFVWFRESGVDLQATDEDGNNVVRYRLEAGHPDMAEWVRMNGV
jgi:hypothetical protein